MLLRTTSTLALLLLISFVGSSVIADSWGPPQKRNYYSADKKYCLEVIPRLLESKLNFNDKDNYARAIFYVRESNGSYTKKSVFPLVNQISPVNALVSADGNYLVTFDNWHRVGLGDDVVVIYRSNGTLNKKFSLEDLFTEVDVKSFFRTASSRWWGSHHYLDDEKNILHLKPALEGRSREVMIDLASGQPLEPEHDQF